MQAVTKRQRPASGPEIEASSKAILDAGPGLLNTLVVSHRSTQSFDHEG